MFDLWSDHHCFKGINLVRHYETHHTKCDQYKEQLWEVKSTLNNQQSMFTNAQKYNEAADYTAVGRKF